MRRFGKTHSWFNPTTVFRRSILKVLFILSFGLIFSPHLTVSATAASIPETESMSERRAYEPPGTIICGLQRNVVCRLPQQICCQALWSAWCTAPGTCTGLAAPIYCDGPEDCGGNYRICCAKFSYSGSITHCTNYCPGTREQIILCHDNNDCSSPNRCLACRHPGGGQVFLCGQNCPF